MTKKEIYTFWGLWIGSIILITIINLELFSNIYITKKFFFLTIFITMLGSGLAMEQLKTAPQETIVFLISFITIPVLSIVYYYDYHLPENFSRFMFSVSFWLSMIISITYSKIRSKITSAAKEKVSLDTTCVDSTPRVNDDNTYRPKELLSNEKKISYYCNHPAQPNLSVNEDNTYQTKEALSSENKIIYYDIYHPWHGGSNSEFNYFSGKILDLKKGKSGSVNYFFNLLKGRFDKNIDAIVVVPSHDPLNLHSSVRQLAQELASYNNWYDGTGIVKRIKKINKLAQGGNRNMSVHLNSLTTSNGSSLKKKNVLVFDDVTTSGNSLHATMKLLRESGVNSVYGYAIGYTK